MAEKITKLIEDNKGKEFKIGNDIHFLLNRNDKTYDCFGVIVDIYEKGFEINKVQIDKMNVSDNLIIKFEEVNNGEINLTDNSWY